MVEKGHVHIKPDDVTYMSDELGLHRVENTSHSNPAVSLHLYSPPFKSCQMFDERTGKAMRAPMTFWSKYGEKIHRKKSERMYDVVSTAD
jgi:cysteine dioxygenase